MPNFAEAFTYIYQYFDNIGFLILASVGLILIFGMMGVINMAHGELMMIGAYITAFAYHAGVPAPIAILLAGVGAGLVGIVLERLIVRHFYNQLLSSLVVTWGLSLMLSQGFLLVFGPSVLNVPTPFGGFSVGNLSFGIYRLVLFAVSLALVALVWARQFGSMFTYFGITDLLRVIGAMTISSAILSATCIRSRSAGGRCRRGGWGTSSASTYKSAGRPNAGARPRPDRDFR